MGGQCRAHGGIEEYMQDFGRKTWMEQTTW